MTLIDDIRAAGTLEAIDRLKAAAEAGGNFVDLESTPQSTEGIGAILGYGFGEDQQPHGFIGIASDLPPSRQAQLLAHALGIIACIELESIPFGTVAQNSLLIGAEPLPATGDPGVARVAALLLSKALGHPAEPVEFPIRTESYSEPFWPGPCPPWCRGHGDGVSTERAFRGISHEDSLAVEIEIDADDDVPWEVSRATVGITQFVPPLGEKEAEAPAVIQVLDGDGEVRLLATAQGALLLANVLRDKAFTLDPSLGAT